MNISNYDVMAIVNIKRDIYANQNKVTVSFLGIPIYRKIVNCNVVTRPPIGFQNGKKTE